MSLKRLVVARAAFGGALMGGSDDFEGLAVVVLDRLTPRREERSVDSAKMSAGRHGDEKHSAYRMPFARSWSWLGVQSSVGDCNL